MSDQRKSASSEVTLGEAPQAIPALDVASTGITLGQAVGALFESGSSSSSPSFSSETGVPLSAGIDYLSANAASISSQDLYQLATTWTPPQ